MAILEAASKLPDHERQSYLKTTSVNDGSLLSEVSEALNWEIRMGSFLKEAAVYRTAEAGPDEELGTQIGPYGCRTKRPNGS
jgi:hypothetical protein